MANAVERDPTVRLDRSNCILPPSTPEATSAGRGIISVDVDRSSSVLADVPFEATFKASWFITLQCFVVGDVICFKYNAPRDLNKTPGMGEERGKGNPVRCFTRIDPEESVKSFLERLDMSHASSDGAVDPVGHDIGVVGERSPRHRCNTGIYTWEHEDQQDEVEFTCVTDLEVDVGIVAGPLKSPESIKLIYNLSHTSKEMATSILRTFQHIYAQVVNCPSHKPLRDIDACSHLDRKKIQGWTRMDPTPANTCLHDLILEQCRLRPNDMAVCSWDGGNLTYKELDDLSLRLSHHLTQLAVGPEVFVLSCFEKSTWAIVARLAILRAGGAYISIFASNPPVYLESFRGTVPTVVELSPEWLRTLPIVSQGCDTVQPDNACLVLFTSGSTGTPKGIVQSHQAYATAIRNYARDLQLGPQTRFLHFDDYAFDISNLEFLVPLVLGGCCCVPGPMKTVRDLTREINSLGADTIFLTPTVAIKLEPADVPRLKTLCVGGEPLPRDLFRKWDSSATKLVNQYGMGEVAICCAPNSNIDPVGGAKIGRPSTGTIWVVNPSSPEKLMPIGAVSEILIEGPHLARGYLDETATRRTEAGFLKAVPRWMGEMHPARRNSIRVYRSGDLGRKNHDGTITYLGRKDTILKLDGCRIDALEVEHQARRCLSDKDTIVVDLLGIINGQDEPTLTAFIHLDEHQGSTAPRENGVPVLKDAVTDSFAREKLEEMQASIAQALPQYMIPTTFVLMSWVPRTASKKIDRKKIHMLGQMFYFAQLAQRPKDVSYAQKI